MTTEQIHEGNQLICDRYPQLCSRDGNVLDLDGLSFHSSFDALIPVMALITEEYGFYPWAGYDIMTNWKHVVSFLRQNPRKDSSNKSGSSSK